MKVKLTMAAALVAAMAGAEVLVTVDVAKEVGPVKIMNAVNNGIDFAWFDANGLPRNPNASAPFIAGYTLGDVHDAGVDPYSDRPLEFKDMEVDSDGTVRILFNGYKGEDPGVGYRMRGRQRRMSRRPQMSQPVFSRAIPRQRQRHGNSIQRRRRTKRGSSGLKV